MIPAGVLTQGPMLCVSWHTWVAQNLPDLSGVYTVGMVNFSGQLSMLLMVAMLLTSLPPCRQRLVSYRIFYTLHVLLWPVVVLFAMLHCQCSFWYCAVGLALLAAQAAVQRLWLRWRAKVLLETLAVDAFGQPTHLLARVPIPSGVTYFPGPLLPGPCRWPSVDMHVNTTCIP